MDTHLVRFVSCRHQIFPPRSLLFPSSGIFVGPAALSLHYPLVLANLLVLVMCLRGFFGRFNPPIISLHDIVQQLEAGSNAESTQYVSSGFLGGAGRLDAARLRWMGLGGLAKSSLAVSHLPQSCLVFPRLKIP